MDNREQFFMDLLNEREIRSKRQKDLISRYEKPIISFMLNTPGPKKRTEDLIKFHKLGYKDIEDKLGDKIIATEYYPHYTGMYYLISVDMDPLKLKKIMISLEDTDWGRLYDIDIFDINGNQISRTDLGQPMRKCLICDSIAKECIVSKKHNYSDLINKMNQLVLERLE